MCYIYIASLRSGAVADKCTQIFVILLGLLLALFVLEFTAVYTSIYVTKRTNKVKMAGTYNVFILFVPYFLRIRKLNMHSNFENFLSVSSYFLSYTPNFLSSVRFYVNSSRRPIRPQLNLDFLNLKAIAVFSHFSICFYFFRSRSTRSSNLDVYSK
jgi:hypothetical protein